MGRVENVYKHYDGHKQDNPNMHELVEILCEESRDEGKDITKIGELVKLEINRLYKNKITTSISDPLVLFVREMYQRVKNGEEITLETEKFAKMLAGASFYLKEMESRGEVKYDNSWEMITLASNRKKMIGEQGLYTESMDSLYKYIRGIFKVPSNHNLSEGSKEMIRWDPHPTAFQLEETAQDLLDAAEPVVTDEPIKKNSL